MIPAEKILWQELRGNKLGVHFNLRLRHLPKYDNLKFECGFKFLSSVCAISPKAVR
jgi:hypothetical protein